MRTLSEAIRDGRIGRVVGKSPKRERWVNRRDPDAIRLLELTRWWINKHKLSKGCSKCGYNTHPVALDMHHRNGGEKKFSISSVLARSNSATDVWKLVINMQEFMDEVAKCDVICANCHRIEHFGT